jgi:hypothetical protein
MRDSVVCPRVDTPPWQSPSRRIRSVWIVAAAAHCAHTLLWAPAAETMCHSASCLAALQAMVHIEFSSTASRVLPAAKLWVR